MISELTLQAGIDIPFSEAQLVIHPPTIREIGYIGEEAFFTGSQILSFSKDLLADMDKINLGNRSDFEIFMSILNDGSDMTKSTRENIFSVLLLMFPTYDMKILPQGIAFTNLMDDDKTPHFISEMNFDLFKEYVQEILCSNILKGKKGESDYNPDGALASKIAEKLKKAKMLKAKKDGDDKKSLSLLSRYVSILSVGLKKDKNQILDYTVFQLFDEFKRFELKESNDMYWQAKIAGATGMQEVDNWMDDIHS